MAACLCLIIACICFIPNIDTDGSNQVFYPEGSIGFPEDIHPEIMIDGKIYYWDKVNPLPVGKDYTKYGEISKASKTTPDEECEIMIGSKKANGIIYTSEKTPNAVYICMSADWFENDFIRFISAELRAGYTVYLGGSYYKISNDSIIRELPESCEYLGKLKYIGEDYLPQNNLETNCGGYNIGGFSGNMNGRAVYFDTADPEHIYVYEKRAWQGGEYDSYIKCPKVE